MQADCKVNAVIFGYLLNNAQLLFFECKGSENFHKKISRFKKV
jgi:hypothetical protein